jgi:hypothetical protein
MIDRQPSRRSPGAADGLRDDIRAREAQPDLDTRLREEHRGARSARTGEAYEEGGSRSPGRVA